MPEIVSGSGTAVTTIENPGSDTAAPSASRAKIMTLECVAAKVGFPLRRPVVVEKVAQDGLLTIENKLAPVAVG